MDRYKRAMSWSFATKAHEGGLACKRCWRPLPTSWAWASETRSHSSPMDVSPAAHVELASATSLQKRPPTALLQPSLMAIRLISTCLSVVSTLTWHPSRFNNASTILNHPVSASKVPGYVAMPPWSHRPIQEQYWLIADTLVPMLPT